MLPRRAEWPDDDEVDARLLDVVVAGEMAALDAPHVVVCRALRGGPETLSGPYPSGVAALAVAARIERAEEAAGNLDVEFTVARLLPPRV